MCACASYHMMHFDKRETVRIEKKNGHENQTL